MRRVTRLLAALAIAAAAGSFWGCNEQLDDPLVAEGILTIEKILPASVQADVTPFDPNGVNPTPLTDDTTTVTVKNRPRTADAGAFSDIFIQKSEQYCTFAGATITSGRGTASFTIPSGSSATVVITAVTVSEKSLAAQGDSWKCYVRFLGDDVSGNPAVSEWGSYMINFVDE